MRRFLCLRSSRAGSWLAIPVLMSVAIGLAEISPQERIPLSQLSPEKQGDLLMAHGEYMAAITAYQQGVLTSALIWNKIGMAYHHVFALNEASKAYKTALVIDPRFAPALNNLGAVYQGQKSYKAAEHLYKRALKYEADQAVFYANLGSCYVAQSKYKNGMKAYQKAFELDPTVFDPNKPGQIDQGSSIEQRIATHYYLAKTFAGAGRMSEALFYLRKAMDEGFNDRKRLMEDKDFAVLRKMPEFQQLLAEEHMNE